MLTFLPQHHHHHHHHHGNKVGGKLQLFRSATARNQNPRQQAEHNEKKKDQEVTRSVDNIEEDNSQEAIMLSYIGDPYRAFNPAPNHLHGLAYDGDFVRANSPPNPWYHRPPQHPPLSPPLHEVDDSKEARIGRILDSDEVCSKYEVRVRLGKGGGGVVYSGTRCYDRAPIAIKVICREDITKWSVIGSDVVPLEVQIHLMAQQASSGVVRLLEWFQMGKDFVLILERPPISIDLECYVRTYSPIPQNNIRLIFTNIVGVLAQLHQARIVHKDVKLENILVDPWTCQIKIIDFGASDFLKDWDESSISFGTPCYWPPEYFRYSSYQARTLDVWSLAVVLYAMVEGRLPFMDERQVRDCRPHLDRANEAEFWWCRNLLITMLQPQPLHRLSIFGIFNHPWLTCNATFYCAQPTPYPNTHFYYPV